MANTPYYSKAEADQKNKETFREVESTVQSISAGEGGKSFATLADAQAVSPVPSDGTVFQVEEVANAGYHIYDSAATGGTRFLRKYIDRDLFPETLLKNDFSTNTNGFTALFGTLSIVSGQLSIGDANNSVALQINKSLLEDGKFYILKFDIDLGTLPMVQLQWGWGGDKRIVSKIESSGTYQLEIEATFGASAFYDQPIINSEGVKGTALFDNFEISKRQEKNYFANNATLSSFEKEIENLKRTYYIDNDFSINMTGLRSFNGGTLSLDAGRLKVVSSSSAKGIEIASASDFGMVQGKEYEIEFDLDLGTAPLINFYNYWSNLVYTITESGHHLIRFTWDVNASALPNPLLAPTEACTWYIDNFKVKDATGYTTKSDIPSGNQYTDGDKTTLGEGASNTATEGTAIGAVTIVENIKGTSVGWGAKAVPDSIFGCQPGNESLSIGELAKSYGWRSVGLGPKTHPGGQSTTAVGTGAEATKSHGLALGRGAKMDVQNGIGLGGVGSYELFVGCGASHRYRLPLSGIGIGSRNPVEEEGIKIKGLDAHDNRVFKWGDKASYNKYDEIVFTDGKLYVSQLASNTATPTSGTDSAEWKILNIEGYATFKPNQKIIGRNVYTVAVAGDVPNVSTGRACIYNSSYYVRVDYTTQTLPDVNSDFVNVDASVISNQIQVEFYPFWESNTYGAGKMVYLWESIWIAKSAGVTSLPPKNKISNVDWYRIDANEAYWLYTGFFKHFDTQHEENIDGGHLNIDGGRATGNGLGGNVNFRTAPSSNKSANEKNDLITAGYFDSESNVDSRFLLLDVATGTYKRVSFGAADSAGTGFRTLRVEN